MEFKVDFGMFMEMGTVVELSFKISDPGNVLKQWCFWDHWEHFTGR